jgi:hypothetical protein
MEQTKSNQSAFYGRMFNILDLSMVLAENGSYLANLAMNFGFDNTLPQNA